MSWRAYLEPRDTRAAALTSSAVLVVPTLISLAYELSVRRSGGGTASTLTLLAMAGLAGLSVPAWLLRRRVPGWVWSVIPVVGIGIIVGLDHATHDASAGAQLVLLFPVVYAGALLPREFAWLVAGVAVVGDGAVVLPLLAPDRAMSDLAHFTFTTVAITAVLTQLLDRQDRLVTRLRGLAGTDALTGLGTRRALEEAAGGPVLPAVGRGTGLVLVDVDRFKQINDTYGHPTGDAALVHVARVVQAAARAGDTVVRLGGDELAVLVPGCAAPEVAARGQAILDAVRARPAAPGGLRLQLTVSVGAAHEPGGGALVDLYAAADAALYRAKQSGRDRLVVASPPVTVPTQRPSVAGTPDPGAGAGAVLGAVPSHVVPAHVVPVHAVPAGPEPSRRLDP